MCHWATAPDNPNGAQDIDPELLFPPVQYRIAEDADDDMPYRLPGQGGLGSPTDLRRIQQARQALERYPKGAKRGADAVRVSGLRLSPLNCQHCAAQVCTCTRIQQAWQALERYPKGASAALTLPGQVAAACACPCLSEATTAMQACTCTNK